MEHNGDLCIFDHCFTSIVYYFLSLYQSQSMQYHLLFSLYKHSSEAHAKCRRTKLVKKGSITRTLTSVFFATNSLFPANTKNNAVYMVIQTLPTSIESQNLSRTSRHIDRLHLSIWWLVQDQFWLSIEVGWVCS